MYPKILDFDPVVMTSLTMTLARPCLLPMVFLLLNKKLNAKLFNETFIYRLYRKETIRLQLVPNLRPETTRLSYEIMVSYWLKQLNVYQMELSAFSRRIYIWNRLWHLGMTKVLWIHYCGTNCCLLKLKTMLKHLMR